MQQKTKKIVFIVGTPFSGSTILTNVLNAHSKIFNAGEIDRFPFYKQFEHKPDVYYNTDVSPCFMCYQRDLECSIWSPSFIREIENFSNLFTIYDKLSEKTNCPVIVDSSKNINWLRKVIASSKESSSRQIYVIHTTRHPMAFANSFWKKYEYPFWQGGETWRNINFDILRTINMSHLFLPYLHIRYDDFILNPEQCIQSVCHFLGLKFDQSIMEYWKDETHACGGNASAYLAYLNDGEKFSKLDTLWESSVKNYDETKKKIGEIHDNHWRRELTNQNKIMVSQVPGLSDISQLLGYSLFSSNN